MLRKDNECPKATVLPVFLAVCETTDPDARAVGREYCEWWDGRSAYGMFHTAEILIDMIWTRQLNLENQTAWWGLTVDEEIYKGGGQKSVQCLLG